LGKVAVMIAMLTGKHNAAPIPCTNLKITTTVSPGATAQISDESPKAAMPTAVTRRRPNRSANRPAGIMNAPRAIM
jgi:hypothetical protein